MIREAQHRLLSETFGVLFCAIVFCAVASVAVLTSEPSNAQGLFPESLRTRPDLPHRPPPALPSLPATTSANANVTTTTGSSSPLVTRPGLILPSTAAPMPDVNIRVPADTTRKLGIGPVFNRLADPYRGETFTAGSTTDPKLHDQRFPISGFALKVPLN